MPKQLILLLDGTWNDAEFGKGDTNIVRLREIIAASLPHIDKDDSTRRVYETTKVFYQRGIGTGSLYDRFRGGLLGEGLTSNIREAYTFLSRHYEDGDQIFIFGFSRGAYTARSLAGMVQASGLLRSECCSEENEQEAWDYYRFPERDRLPATQRKLSYYVHPRDNLRIACLGVFDTVGSLGIPLTLLRRWNREHYEFHEVALSRITDVHLHALAIDEHRLPFEATIWRKPKFFNPETKVEQVWFPGSHGDIGGGYQRYGAEAGLDSCMPPALSDISLDWMIKRLKCHFGKAFPIHEAVWYVIPGDMRDSFVTAPIHNSYRLPYSVQPKAVRSIANLPAPNRTWFLRALPYEVAVNFDRHDKQQNEMIHISAIERLGKRVAVNGKEALYAPRNLARVIGSTGGLQIPVVGWDGRLIEPWAPSAIQLSNIVQVRRRANSWRRPPALLHRLIRAWR